MIKLLILVLSFFTLGLFLFASPSSAAVDPQKSGDLCGITFNPGTIKPDTKFDVEVTVPDKSRTYRLVVVDRRNNTIFSKDKQNFSNLRMTFGPINSGGFLDPSFNPYSATVSDVTSGQNTYCGSRNFSIEQACYSDALTPTVTKNHCGPGFTARSVPDDSSSPEVTTFHCECIPSDQLPTFNPPSNQGGQSNISGIGKAAPCVKTDLGCIPTDPGKLASAVFSIILGLAGGLAILMIIVGGFKVATSQGNVDALQDGRDTITKAITGLAFILLATTILAIIGIDILGIPFFRRDGTGIIIN